MPYRASKTNLATLFTLSFPALLILLLIGFSPFGCDDKKAPGPKVLVLGLDGADFEIIKPLSEAGRLPNITKLMKSGVYGELKSIEPTLSPVIWTSIATGKTPDKHGITWFMVRDPDTKEGIPVTSDIREVKALWNIASEKGKKVGVIGWWATWPAETVNGFIISDHIAFHGFGLSALKKDTDIGKTHPPELLAQIETLIKDPLTIPKSVIDKFMNITLEEYDYSVRLKFDFGNPLHHFMYALTTARLYESISLKMLEQEKLDLTMIYFEGIDTVGHMYMKYKPPRMEGLSDEYFYKYSSTVESYYEYQDKIIGNILAKVPEDTNVVLLSDHGFKTGADRLSENLATDVRTAHLWHRLQGVLIMSGPAIKTGGVKLEGATVMDIAPTILTLLGLPVAKDMDGEPLKGAIRPEFLAEYPIKYIETYEEAATKVAGGAKRPHRSDIDPEIEEKLKALGYLGQYETLEVDINRADALKKKGDFDGAIKLIRKTLAGKEDNVKLHITLASLLSEAGKCEEAIGVYSKALKMAEKGSKNLPKDIALVAALTGRGTCLMTLNKVEEAEADYEKALEMEPANLEARYNLGFIKESKNDLKAAIEHYKQAVLIAPNHAWAHNNLGNCLTRSGKKKEAVEHFKLASENAPNHIESRYNLGVLLTEMGKADEARNALESALMIEPRFTLALFALGNLELQEGRPVEAKVIFTKLAGLESMNPVAWMHLAKAEAMAGENSDAEKHLSRALALDHRLKEQAAKDKVLKKVLKSIGN